METQTTQILCRSADVLTLVLANGSLDDDSRNRLQLLRRAITVWSAAAARTTYPKPVLVEELELDVRPYNRLKRHGIDRVSQVEELAREGRLNEVPGIGPAAVAEIDLALARIRAEHI